jgi:Mg-dependent DNase
MSKSNTKQERPSPASLHLPPGGADSHAHLDGLVEKARTDEERKEKLEAVMDLALGSGVSTIGQVFLSPEALERGRGWFDAWPQVFFLLGIHPNEAMQLTGQTLAAMRSWFAREPRLKAVGEIGLDLYWDDCPLVVQEEAFRLQLALAKEVKLPVVIHSREAAEPTLNILEAEGLAGHPLLWHCFGGDDAIAVLDRLLANGWHISVPGPVTYPANTALREAVGRIPHDRLLLETDCPYLTPLPWRGKPNQPAFTAFTAQTVAACLGMEVAELWALCGANTRRFFGLDGGA